MTETRLPPPPPKMSKPPPPPAKANGATTTTKQYSLGRIKPAAAQRIVIYGTGGIGKSTLACLAARKRRPIGYVDMENTLGLLQDRLKEHGVADMVRPVDGIESWDDLRGALHAPIWDECQTIVIDSGSRAELLATAWTLANVPHEKGHRVSRIEDYGFGKGIQHTYDTFLFLLADLDAHVKAGRNVIVICHDVVNTVPNPTGEDYLRWEPKLQHPNSQKSSIRLAVKEWSDHLFFVGYDVGVNADGVAIGSGTRTIYPVELPWCMAKSRTIGQPMPYPDGDDTLWQLLFRD